MYNVKEQDLMLNRERPFLGTHLRLGNQSLFSEHIF